jgi:hypothetical protein
LLRQIRQGGFTHLRVCTVNHVPGTRPDHLIEVIVGEDVQPIRTYGIKNDLGNLLRLHTLPENLLKNCDALLVFRRQRSRFFVVAQIRWP